MGEVILVASGKGGVGKTVIAANLGAVLSRRGASVVLMDMNIGLRSLDICLGLENRIIYDLSDALSGVCRRSQALVKDRRFSELYLISAPQSRKKTNITISDMKGFCEELKESFDYIIVDGPAGIDEGMLLAAAPADRAVIVSVPEYAAIRDADLVDGALRELDIQKRAVVVNKVMRSLYGKSLVPDPSQIAESLHSPICGMITYDENIHISSNIGIPIALAEGSYIEKNFSNITERIIKL